MRQARLARANAASLRWARRAGLRGKKPGTGRGLGNGQCTSGGGGSVAGGAGRRRCGERRESDAVGGLFVILA